MFRLPITAAPMSCSYLEQGCSAGEGSCGGSALHSTLTARDCGYIQPCTCPSTQVCHMQCRGGLLMSTPSPFTMRKAHSSRLLSC